MTTSVQEDAKFVTEHAKSVRINDEKIASFVSDLDRAKFAKLSEPVKYPLQFDERSRVNFECVKDLLEFGSGWRRMLKQVHGKGAHETIITGVFSLFISDALSARQMSALSLLDVGLTFDIPIDAEKPIGEHGIIKEMVEHPIRPLAIFLQRVLNESGAILQQRNCADFYELICRELKPSKEEPLDALKFVEMMRATFPAFNDVAVYQNRQVKILKKVQMLASDLRVASDAGAISWKVENWEKLSIFADNVIPCVMRHLGILEIDEKLAERIDSGKVLATGDEEIELRMCAIEAAERICSSAEDLTHRNLDLYLWSLSREAAWARIKERKERRARGELPGASNSRIESSQFEDDLDVAPAMAPPKPPPGKLRTGRASPAPDLGRGSLDSDYSYLMMPPTQESPKPPMRLNMKPSQRVVVGIGDEDDYNSSSNSSESPPKMPSPRPPDQALKRPIPRLQPQSQSLNNSPVLSSSNQQREMSSSGTVLSPRRRQNPTTRTPAQTVWRKSPGTMKVVNEEGRRIMGTRSMISEETFREQDGDNDPGQRKRGMTEELEGFLGDLGISGLKKSPRETSSVIVEPPLSPQWSPRAATRSPPRSPRGNITLGSKSGSKFVVKSQRPVLDCSRAPTVAELEREIDYCSLDQLPPLPISAPITNKAAYKGYMKLKFAWSERRNDDDQDAPIDAIAEDLMHDIFDSESMALHSIEFQEGRQTERFSDSEPDTFDLDEMSELDRMIGHERYSDEE